MTSRKSSPRSRRNTHSASPQDASKSRPSKHIASNNPDAEKQEAIRAIRAKLIELERIAKEQGFENVQALIQFAQADIEAAIKSDG